MRLFPREIAILLWLLTLSEAIASDTVVKEYFVEGGDTLTLKVTADITGRLLLSVDEHLIAEQRSPSQLGLREYLFLSPSADTSFKVEVIPHSTYGDLPKPIEFKTLTAPAEQAKLLMDVSRGWRESRNAKLLLERIDALFQSTEVSEPEVMQDLVFFGAAIAIHYGELGDAEKYLRNIASASDDVLLLTANLAFARGKFSDVENIANRYRKLKPSGGWNSKLLSRLGFLELFSRQLKMPVPSRLVEMEQPIRIGIADAQRIGNPLLIGEWLQLEISRLSFLNRHREAQEIGYLAINLLSREGFPEALASLYNSLAINRFALGAVADGRKYLQLALDSAEKYSAAKELAVVLSNHAEIRRRLGDLSEAEKYYNRSLALTETISSTHGMAQQEILLGSLFREQGKPEKALRIHLELREREALADFESHRIDVEIARDYLAIGDLSLAESSASDVLGQSGLRPSTKMDALNVQLEIAIRESNAEKVRRLDKSIRPFAKTLGSGFPFRRMASFRLFLDFYSRQKEYKHITFYRDSIMDLVDSVQRQQRLVSHRDDWAKELNKGVDALVRSVVALGPTDLDVGKLFHILEKYHSVDPFEEVLLTSKLIDSSKSKAIKEAWQALLDKEQQQIAASDPDSVKSVDRVHEEITRFYSLIADGTQRERTKILTLVELQERMRVDDLFLRYYQSSTLSFLLVIGKTHSAYLSLPSKAQVAMKLAHIYSGKLPKLLAATLVDLLPSISALDGISRIVIVPDGMIHSVPLEAAALSNGEFFGTSYMVDRTLSASHYFGAKDVVPTHWNNDFSIFVDPDFGAFGSPNNTSSDMGNWRDRMERLPFSKLEANSILRSFPKARATVRSGLGATTSALMSDSFRNAEVLHIASHGYYDDESPDLVALATAKQNPASLGFLSSTEFLSRPIRVKLAVISGCQTALGTPYEGRGQNSLVRGLAAGRADAVIGTLWAVTDRSSAKFFDVFYSSLAEDDGNVSVALKNTRRRLSKEMAIRDWSAFVLTTGRTSVVLGSSSTTLN